MGTDWVAPVVGGLVTVYAVDKIFGKDKKTRTVTKTKYVTRKPKSKKKTVRKSKGNWKKGIRKDIQKYI